MQIDRVLCVREREGEAPVDGNEHFSLAHEYFSLARVENGLVEFYVVSFLT
jgi:hypothetical protein